MSIRLTVEPRFDDEDEKNASAPSASAELRVIFSGLPVSAATTIILAVAKPHVVTVSDVQRRIADFCVEQQRQSSGGNAAAAAAGIVADIKLNLAGVNLTDPNERIDHAMQRCKVAAKMQQPAKLYVSGKFTSAAERAASSHSGGGGGDLAGVRRDRNAGAAADPLTPNMTPEQADAMANMMSQMMAGNPELLFSMDPSLREAVERNPELRQTLSDPDSLREIIRNQLSRDGRAQGDAAMRGIMGQIGAHPEGAAMIENALGRAGMLNDPGRFTVSRTGAGSIAEAEQREQQQRGQHQQHQQLLGTASNEPGPLLPLAPGASLNPFGVIGAAPAYFAAPPAATSSATLQQQQQQQAAEEERKKRVAACMAALQEMGIEAEMAELAATEAAGDVDKALSLIEEWQE